MVTLVLALGVVAAAISGPTCAALALVGRRLGYLDQPGREQHKKHAHAVPNTGGIGIFLAIAIPLVLILTAAWLLPVAKLVPAAAEHLDGLRRHTPMALAVLVALLVVHIMGLIDDRVSLKAMTKLAVELVIATVLAAGFDFRVLHLLDQFGPAGYAASVAVSVLWIGVITNAMNMLDNMDGLSAGVGAIIAGFYLAATLIGGQWFVAAMAALLVGALIGFLVLNFPPAKMFMGDGGSLVLGMLLALISVRTTYWVSETNHLGGAVPGHHAAWYGLLMPLMVMAIPLYDFLSVTTLRMLRGESPFRGDHNHFSHRLVRRGLSRRGAVILIWLCTLATGLGGVMLGTLNQWQALLAAAQTVAVVAVLALLEISGHHASQAPPAGEA
ncbi:MAG: undecaprenyl/decaprenyl-phosphate alpha-N-acetylglucosaminyl 1-phosphate transferase [Phycisphaeraceae bacterium]|nr:undecaprenyl/decaprenyl-phosphate alpha-N-acetylglucosaminyl 1-phosphate transferase [Phycisphaeraceae bacterium]